MTPRLSTAMGSLVLMLIGTGTEAVAATEPAVHLSSNCPADRAKIASSAEAKCYAMEYGGRERTLRIYAPADGSRAARSGGGTRPVPLVLVLHGSGGDSGGMEWVSERGFNRIADREGAVIVYPDGVGKSWNDGRPDVKSAAVKENVDDLGWLRSLPEALGAFIDRKRVYAAGMSNGGLMSLRLACDAADVFAAVAPVVANMSGDLAPVCKPARPIPVLILRAASSRRRATGLGSERRDVGVEAGSSMPGRE